MTSIEASASTPESTAEIFHDVKTIDAKHLTKMVSIASDEVKTPEIQAGKAMTAVTTAVKTPCFISYVDSTTNTPASDATNTPSTSSGSPTVEVEASKPSSVEGSPNDSMTGVFRTIATPATAKKIKKVKAKGVTLFDEAEFRGDKLVSSEVKNKKRHGAVAIAIFCFAIVGWFLAPSFLNGASTSSLSTIDSYQDIRKPAGAVFAEGVAMKVKQIHVGAFTRARVLPIVSTIQMCLKAGLLMRGTELEEALLAM